MITTGEISIVIQGTMPDMMLIRTYADQGNNSGHAVYSVQAVGDMISNKAKIATHQVNIPFSTVYSVMESMIPSILMGVDQSA